jgi:hypothetical protein
MPLQTGTMRPGKELEGKAVFVSASIPDPARWSGEFDSLEITDSVTAAARAILTESGTLVTAAHPTIAPLLLYVAAEFPKTSRPSIVVYQSRLFQGTLPEATRRFEDAGTGVIRWTSAADGETPEPGQWNKSLEVMRQAMLTETDPSAAIFIGGMDGITDEYLLFRAMFRNRPWYALGRPGGVARELAITDSARLRGRLLDGDVYPSLMRIIVADILESLPPNRTDPR